MDKQRFSYKSLTLELDGSVVGLHILVPLPIAQNSPATQWVGPRLILAGSAKATLLVIEHMSSGLEVQSL
jgi:hypothetical protein